MKKPKRLTAAAAVLIAVSVIPLSAAAAYTYTKIAGDINGDGKVSKVDVVLAKRAAAGKQLPDGREVDMVAGDIDRSGIFDSTDAEQIARKVAGWQGYDAVGKEFTNEDVAASFRLTDISFVQEDEQTYANLTVTGGAMPYIYAWYRLGADSCYACSVPLSEQTQKIELDPGDAYYCVVSDADLNRAESGIWMVGADGTASKVRDLDVCAIRIRQKKEGSSAAIIKDLNAVLSIGLSEAGDLYEAAQNDLAYAKRFMTESEAYTFAKKLTDYCEWYEVHVYNEKENKELLFADVAAEEKNSSYTLSAAVSGGDAPYTYEWVNIDTGKICGTDSVFEVTPVKDEVYELTVKDSSGHSFKPYKSRVSPTKVLAEITQEPTGSGSTVITANVTYGTAPFTYKWRDKSGNVLSTGSTLSSYTVSALKTCGLNLNVTDADGRSCDITDIAIETAEQPQPAALAVAAEPRCIANPFPSWTGTSAYDNWSYTNEGTASVTIEGGQAPYLYTWYIDGEENYGLTTYDLDTIKVKHGIESLDKTCSIRIDTVRDYGKKCWCVITDANGEQVTTDQSAESQILVFNSLSDIYKPSALTKTADASAQNILVDMLVYDTLHMQVRFQGGSKIFSKYQADVYYRKKGSDEWVKFDGTYGTGHPNDYYDYDYDTSSFIFHSKCDLTYLREQNIRTDKENFRIVITDTLTDSAVEYTTYLSEAYL